MKLLQRTIFVTIRLVDSLYIVLSRVEHGPSFSAS
jgi:hypothetical protein